MILCGQVLDYTLHALVRHLNLVYQGANNCMEVVGLDDDFFGCCLHTLVSVEIESKHHVGEFLVELLLPLLHCLVEELFW